jgi:hypothetical protein
MCKYIKDKDKGIDTIYQCKNLKDINYFTYNIGDKNIMIENTGLIAKIIDFGQSGVIVDKLEVLDNGYNQFHSGSEAKEQTNGNSEFFTMEYVFFLINMFKKYVENIGFKSIFLDCIIYLLKNLKDSENDELISDNILNNILEVENVLINNDINIINHNEKVIFKHTYSHTGYTVEYPDDNVNIKRIDGVEYKMYSWFMNRRNTGVAGVKNPQNYFINRLLLFLKNIGQSSDSLYWITNNSKTPLISKVDSSKVMIFNYDIKKGVDNELIKYYKKFSYYTDMCNENTLKEEINYDNIFDNIITEDDGTYDNLIKLATNSQKCMLYKNQIVDRYSLSNYYKPPLFTRKPKNNDLLNGSVSYKLLEINPGISDIDYLKFKKDQRWVDYKYINKYLVKTPVWNVRIHLLKLKKKLKIRFNLNKSLWQASTDDSNDGLFINGGYFIVNKNLQNELGLKVGFDNPPTKNDLYKPIGYYMDENGATIILNVPYGYENSYGAIIVNNNKIKLMRYNDFLKKHELEKSKQLIQLQNDNIVTVESLIIKTNDKNPVIKDDKFKYDMAFVSGPVVVWNNKVVFNDKTINEKLEYRGKTYKVAKQAKDSYKFNALEDEKDFPYGQRHSNTYMNHNVIAEDEKGNTTLPDL